MFLASKAITSNAAIALQVVSHRSAPAQLSPLAFSKGSRQDPTTVYQGGNPAQTFKVWEQGKGGERAEFSSNT